MINHVVNRLVNYIKSLIILDTNKLFVELFWVKIEYFWATYIT